jgi:H+/Cl- antiporter ClcA
MAESSAQKAAAIETAASAVQGLDPAAQQTAMAAVSRADQTTANELWKYLVIGLLVLDVIALVGVVYLLADSDADTSPDVALTAFTAVLTGLIGLFAPSPVTNTDAPASNPQPPGPNRPARLQPPGPN